MTAAPGASPLGLARCAVRLVGHDLCRPALFAAERERLLRALGHVLSIEHVGSTAVPGPAAKRTIDLMIGVDGEAARWTLIGPLGEAGDSRGDGDVIEGRLYLRRNEASGLRAHPASVCAAGSRFRLTHRGSPDALRLDAAHAVACLHLKQKLAALLLRARGIQ